MLNQQLPIDGIDPPPLTTLFKARESSDRFPFEHFFIEHEKTEHAPGRTGSVSFQQYIHRYPIHAYHHRTNNLLLLCGKKRAVNDLIRQGGLTLKVQSIFLDLNEVQEGLESVHMVWFRFFEGQFSSTSFHGENIKAVVEQQDLFRRGRISNMSFTLRYGGKAHPLMLSHDGTMVLQTTYEDIEEELSVLNHFYEKHLKPALTDESLMHQQPRWKEEIADEFEEALQGITPYSLYSGST
jgi:hypothetical protein